MGVDISPVLGKSKGKGGGDVESRVEIYAGRERKRGNAGMSGTDAPLLVLSLWLKR